MTDRPAHQADLDTLRERIVILEAHNRHTHNRLDTLEDTLSTGIQRLSQQLEDLHNWRKNAFAIGGSIGGGVAIGLLSAVKYIFGH